MNFAAPLTSSRKGKELVRNSHDELVHRSRSSREQHGHKLENYERSKNRYYSLQDVQGRTRGSDSTHSSGPAGIDSYVVIDPGSSLLRYKGR
jgi:hypothetical protein